jgi:uncharacterized membrane protein
MGHRQVIALLAVVGFFVALYLWLHNIGVIGELKCGSGGCETVQASVYARMAGVPVAFFGVIGYAAIFAVAYVGLQPAWAARRGPTLLLAALAAGGVLFTGYLTYLELFVIHAICRWCVTSAAIIVAICVVALGGLARRPTT